MISAAEPMTGLADPEVTALADAQGGVVWLATAYSDGLLICDGGKLSRVSLGSVGVASGLTTSLFVDRRGRVWGASAEGQLFSLDGAELRGLRGPTPTAAPLSLITEDPAGRIWVCERGGGVSACFRDGQRDEDFEALVQSMGVSCVHRASDGAIWALAGGLDSVRGLRATRFDGARWRDVPIDLPRDAQTPVALHADAAHDVLYLSTKGGILRLKDGAVSRLSPRDLGLDGESLSIVTLDRRDNLWVTWSFAHGSDLQLSRYDGVNAIDFSSGTPIQPTEDTRVVEDDRGRLWFGDRLWGLCLLDKQGWTVFSILDHAALPEGSSRRQYGQALINHLNARRQRVYSNPLSPEASEPRSSRRSRSIAHAPATPDNLERERYERFAIAASELPAANVHAFVGDTANVLAVVRRAVQAVSRDPARARRRLPKSRFDAIRSLPELAIALHYTATRMAVRADAPQEVARRLDLLYEAFRPTLVAAEVCFTRGLVPETFALVRRALMAGDPASAAAAITDLLTDRWRHVHTRISLDLEDVRRVNEAAKWLLQNTPAPERMDSRDIRDRLSTLLRERYEVLRGIAQELHGASFEAVAPDLHVGPPAAGGEEERGAD